MVIGEKKGKKMKIIKRTRSHPTNSMDHPSL